MNEHYCNDSLHNTCISIVKKAIDVCTPIMLETVVNVEDILIKCDEAQIICESERHCNNKYVYEFSVRQTLCIEMPLKYKTEACASDSVVDC